MKSLLFCLLASTASAQLYTNGPLIEVSSVNLFAACTADTPGFVPSSEVEPSLAVNPTNPNNLIGIWQQDRFSDGGSRGDIVGASFDGGATWQSVFINDTVLCDGGSFQRASDPWVSFAPDGTAHLIVLSLNPDTGSGFGADALLASRSTDGGLNWSMPVTLITTSDPSVLNDKESITADPLDANFVYAIWDRLQPFRGDASLFTGPTLFARSTNAGATWEPARVIFEPGKFKQTIGNQIVVLPEGTLVNVAAFLRSNVRGARQYALATQRSFDRGMTWERKARRNLKLEPRGAFAPDRMDVFDPETQQPLRTGEIIPAVAVDPVTGALYVVWQDSRFSDHAIDEIAFAQSTNAGRHWSKPVKINLSPTGITVSNRQAFTPSIRVAADGTICVTYYDFRFNDSGSDLKTDYWAIFCKPTGGAPATDPANWGNELRLTDASFDIRQAPFARGFFVGDYEGLAAAGNDFIAFFSQSHAADPASIFARRLSPAP